METQIRLARPADAEQILAIYAPFIQSTPTSFEVALPSKDEMAARIVKTLDAFPWLVGISNDVVLGYVYASRHRDRAAYQWSVDVSAYIHEAWRGRGLGRVLYHTLFDLLRAQGFVNVYAGITLPNPGSVGLHEAMGMHPVGVYEHVGYKLGAWHDVGWWQGKLQPIPDIPATPTPFPVFTDSEAWNTILAKGSTSLASRLSSLP